MDILIYFGILAAGIILGFVLRKYLFEQNSVAKNDFMQVEQKLYRLESQQSFSEKEASRLENELSIAKSELKSSTDELTALAGNYAALTTSNEYLTEKLDNQVSENAKIKAELIENIEKLTIRDKNITELSEQNKYLKEKMETNQADSKILGEEFTNRFKILADTILDEKSKKFTEINSLNISRILEPLGEKIVDFKKKVEETYDKESKQRFSLEEKIKELATLNAQISKEAQNLTKALKGDTKKQGNWGEMILENILENSGLQKGREYFVQEFMRTPDGKTIENESGRKLQPDIVIRYPDKRKIIIDSKVSLVAYEKYSSAENIETQKTALEEHLKSLKSHVDNLSAKKYHEYADDTLDFVMLFVPIEPAYMDAVRHDPNLWDYAYKKRILLISPTNLIAALKLVSDLWQREYQNQNAIEIAERGGKLYDKFVNFVSSLNDIGQNINKANQSYEEAVKQLQTGSGNLLGQVEKLKKLGAKAQKSLPIQNLSDDN